MTPTAGPMKDFFISYRTATGREWAVWIDSVLHAAGYTTVLQARDFRPGTNFILDMSRGLAGTSRMIAVLSEGYFDSEYTSAEWADAFNRDPSGFRSVLLPIRVGDVSLPPLLRTTLYVDLVGARDKDRARELILDAVRRDDPELEPVFPGGEVNRDGFVVPRPRVPGALPGIHNLPRRNPRFTWRDELMESVRSHYGSDSAAFVALHGIGGVGKTACATEYAHRHADHYDVIWFVHADTVPVLEEELSALAPELSLCPASFADQDERIRRVLRWLSTHSRWLLVFDDAPDPETIAPYLPATLTTGHILVTSRDPHWEAHGRAVEVKPWRKKDATEFLLRNTGSEEVRTARALSVALGCLPLALELVVSYPIPTAEPGRRLHEYHRRYRKHRLALLDEVRPNGLQPISFTLALMLASVEAESGEAVDLVGLLAYLASAGVPVELLRQGRAVLPRELRDALEEPLEWDRLVRVLRRRSLLQVSDEGLLSVHPLIREAFRHGQEPNERRRSIETVFELLRICLPSDPTDPTTRQAFAPAAAQIEAVCQAALEFGGFEELVIQLLLDGSRFYRSEGQLTVALRMARRAASLADSIYGHEHRTVAESQLVLSEAWRDSGQLMDACSSAERALAIVSSLYGVGHSSSALYHCNLGRVLYMEKRLYEAQQCFEQALAIAEHADGPHHPSVSVYLSGLGHVLEDLGQLSTARPLIERALAIKERSYGPQHPEVASNLNDLGRILRGLGKAAAARTLLERALTIVEHAYGLERLEIAFTLNDLGRVLQDMGELAAARTYLERGVAISEHLYGPHHPHTAVLLANLQSVLEDLGELTAARANGERALAITEHVYGPHHPNVAVCLCNLGSILRSLGEPAASRPLFQRALAISEQAYGIQHPNVVVALSNLAGVNQALGDPDAARSLLERALVISEHIYGPKHPHLAITLTIFGRVLKDLGSFEAARFALERARQILVQTVGSHHWYYAAAQHIYGDLLTSLGDATGAVEQLVQARETIERQLGSTHIRLARVLDSLGDVYRIRGDLGAAEAACRRAVSIHAQAVGEDSYPTAWSRRGLALVLRDAGGRNEVQALLKAAYESCLASLGTDHPKTRQIEADLQSLAVA